MTDELAPLDTSDPTAVQQQVKSSKQRAAVLAEALRGIMSTESGRTWMHSLLLKAPIGANPFVVDSNRTAFNCGTPELAGLLIVYGTDAETVGDCRAFGELPERWADWGFSACPDEVSVRASAG